MNIENKSAMNTFKNKQTPEYKEKQRHRLRMARIWGYRIGKKYQIGDRINKANAWANAHRRKAVGITLAVNFCIYLIGFAMCFADSKANNGITDPMQDFAAVQPMFAQIHHIHDMKQVEKSSFVALTGRVVKLKHEVDSLMDMPGKTHQDSILALEKYDELKMIMNK